MKRKRGKGRGKGGRRKMEEGRKKTVVWRKGDSSDSREGWGIQG
ncbi:MAG: hypothetical protein ABII64_00005 [Elusimicrobiota bacterium]